MSKVTSSRARKRWEILSAVIKTKELSDIPHEESKRQFKTFNLMRNTLTGNKWFKKIMFAAASSAKDIIFQMNRPTTRGTMSRSWTPQRSSCACLDLKSLSTS
jgi:hypothetical protein